MTPFVAFEGLVGALDRADVDTDAILPKQFMKSIERVGFGPHLFDGWRYLEPGEPGQDGSRRALDPRFELNAPRYAGLQILLARRNFGCGSSREHAVWAIAEFGIRALLAPSFASLFEGNCLKNGLLPITLPEAEIDALFDAVHAMPGYRLGIDLAAQTVRRPDGTALRFDIDPFRKHCLLAGLDEIALTLRHRDEILRHEAARRAREPWLFGPVAAGRSSTR